MVSEIIHRLIDGERKDFQNGLQRVLNRVPRRGSTTEPEFSTYFFLGSVLTLPYTKLNGEIGVKASSVKITSDETVKLVFKIEKDGKTKLVFRTIAIGDKIDTAQKLTVDEFKEALGSLDLTQDELNNCEVEGEIVHIESIKEKRRTKGKKRAVIDRKVSLKGLEVIGKGELNSKTLKEVIGDHGPLPEYNEKTAKFKKVKDNIIEKGSLDGALKEFSEKSLKAGSGELSPSAKGAEAFFENLAQVYKSEIVFQSDSKQAKDKKLQLSIYEAPTHGFAYGTLAMNFRYEYALDISVERGAGKGFVDLRIASHGHECYVELKGKKGTAQDAQKQIEREGYAKGPERFGFRGEQKEEKKWRVLVGANLSLDPGNGGLLVKQSQVPPKPEGLIELFKEYNDKSLEELKEKLKEKLNYLYYSISDSNGGGKNTNYLSRLTLGELLAGNSLEKHVFIYEESVTDTVSHETRSEKGRTSSSTTPMNEMVSTFVLKVKDDKYIILNIMEDKAFKAKKSIPLDKLNIDPSKCTEVNIKVNPEAQGGFEVENDINKSYYQGIEMGEVTSSGSEYYEGKFEKIGHVDLRDITDLTQIEKLKVASFPLRELLRLENHSQAILQGLLSAQKDVGVWTEPNYSSKGRPDLMVAHRGLNDEIHVASAELKVADKKEQIEGKVKEGQDQLRNLAGGLEAIVKQSKVGGVVFVFYSSAENIDDFITHRRVADLDVEQSSRGSSDGEPPAKRRCSGVRKERSIGKLCIDSRDEESTEEKRGKEELIKELFDSDEIRERIKNVEFYDQLFRVSERISGGETIDQNVEEAFITKIKDIDLNSIDPEVKGIVGKIKEKISGLQINKALEDILKEPEVAEKIGKVASSGSIGHTAFLTKDNEIQKYVNKINSNPKLMNHLDITGKISGQIMQVMMYKNLIDDIFSGNYKGVAINLGFIAGDPFLSKLAEVASARGIKFTSEGKVILGGALKAASPFIARATSAFIIYDLVNQVKALKAGNKDALVGVVGDGIYLSVDVAEVGVELAELAGILEGVSSVTGPIGAAIGAIVLVGTEIYLAVRTVEQEDKIIHLTGLEKFKEGWRAFLHMKPEQHIEDLIEEKEANDQLVRGGIEFLKQHTDIQRYVFPTGKSVVDSCQFVKKRREICGSGDGYLEDDPSRCRSGTGMYNEVDVKECTPPRIQPDLESSVDFVEKMDIFPSRASPDNPEEGELFCLPLNPSPSRCYTGPFGDFGDCQSSNAYRCNSAIGVSYTKDRTGNYTLIALGKGTDVAVGFKGSPNIFLVEDGRKYFEGGDEDDIFVLSGSEITGDLDGGSGDNAIDFGGFRVGQGSLLIDPRLPIDGLEWINMNNILGREGRKDFIYCDHNTKYIDGRGGKDKNAPDNIILHNCTSDHGELTIAVKPYTRVENHLSLGNFTYVIHQGKGNSLIFIAGRGKHSFLFNYTLQNIEAVISYKGSVMFTFSNLNNVSINGAPCSDISYTLSDGTKIVVNKNSTFALQSSDKSADEIIKDYSDIANRLNMTIAVQSSNESIIIGHGKHEVLHNNHEFNSHLVGNGGENIYVIAPTQKEINIYDVDEESSIDTLDLRNVMKKVQNGSLKISRGENDLLVELEGGESLLKFPIRVKNGTLWYKKLHVVRDSMPMQINKHSNDAWSLGLVPLAFDNNIKIAVITAKDVGTGNKLIVREKAAGQYAFSRLRDDLIIITDPSLGENNACTILLRNFYKEPRMKTLSIKFEDITISLQKQMRKIGKAVAFCPRVLQMNKEFSVNGSNLLSSYDCLKFNSDEILFLRSGNSLLLLSDKGKLLMSNYYSDVHEKWNLPVELNDDIITSEEFIKRANNPSSFRYYQMNDQKALKIYHNQPENKHYVGLVDLKDKSILKCRVRITNNGLILSLENGNFIKVENVVNSESRKIMFVFSDAIVSNEKCIFSTCNPEDIIEEFRKKQVELVNKKGKDINAPPDYVEKSGSVNVDNSSSWLIPSQEERNEESKQRYRRHHIRHENHHRGHRNQRSPIQEVTSSSVRPSSWINVFTNTIVDAVKGVSKFIFSPFKPAIDMEHSQPFKAMTTQSIDTNGTLLLLDVFIRKITGQKYISNNIRSPFEKEAQIYALPIARGFEQALESAAIESGIPVTNLKFDPTAVSSKVVGQIRSGKFSEISKTLYSSAKEACPEFEQTGEFLVHVKSHLEEFLAKKETVFLQQKQTADQPTSSVSRKVVAMEPSKKPDTFLSDTSVAKGIKHVLGL